MMKAAYVVKKGSAHKAFEIREVDKPVVNAGEVGIEVEAFGLNFADVMIRMGTYSDAPPFPTVPGYDVVGKISEIHPDTHTDLQIGDRVIALTRFGGYAEYVATDVRAVAKVMKDTPATIATALSTQGCTAYYMAKDFTNIHPGDHVLVHAAAGGVGSLLCQMAKSQGAIVYGTASTPEKLNYLRSIGVDHPINYKEESFDSAIKKILNKDKGLDLIFDAVGGNSIKKGLRLLEGGGRIVCFGAAALTSAKTIFGKIGVALGFGLYSPIALLNPSRSLMAVNMLTIGDEKPHIVNRVMNGVIQLYNDGIIQPLDGGLYSIDQLADAHDALENRKTMGKVAVKW